MKKGKNLGLLVSLAIVFDLIRGTSSLAGTGSHGGDVAFLDGTPYLLDFVEEGIEKSPYLDTQISPDPEIDAYLARTAFPDEAEIDRAPIVRKLSEIARLDRIAALTMTLAMGMYRWKLMDWPLANINDEESPIEFPDKNLVQAANRLIHTIRIHRSTWKRMDPIQQAGLIFHEILCSNSLTMNWSSPNFRGRQATAGLFLEPLSPRALRTALGPLFFYDLRQVAGLSSLTTAIQKIPGRENAQVAVLHKILIYSDVARTFEISTDQGASQAGLMEFCKQLTPGDAPKAFFLKKVFSYPKWTTVRKGEDVFESLTMENHDSTVQSIALNGDLQRDCIGSVWASMAF